MEGELRRMKDSVCITQLKPVGKVVSRSAVEDVLFQAIRRDALFDDVCAPEQKNKNYSNQDEKIIHFK